ncbi:hypothetical protein SCH4B_0901 [Ruegeria sp. TrichCH4B]|nr:hypothetical protein SCH4B_0901 [Ruegeria sp. TrichCH4B]
MFLIYTQPRSPRSTEHSDWQIERRSVQRRLASYRKRKRRLLRLRALRWVKKGLKLKR